MMIKKITPLLILIALSLSGYSQIGVGQKLSDKQEISFDSKGQMIKFPRAFVRKSSQLDFSVMYSKSKMQKHFDRFTELLEKTQNTIKENKDAYDCIFNKYQQYADFQKHLDLAIRTLKHIKVDSLSSMDSAESIVKSSNMDDFLPISSYLKNWKSQYAVHAGTAGDFRLIKNLRIIPGAGTDTCYYLKNETPIRVKDLDCGNCPEKYSDEFHFKLLYNDPLLATISQWYAASALAVKDSIESRSDIEQGIIDGLKDAANAADSEFKDDMDAVSPVFRFILMRWMWISGGQLTPNPFNSVTEDFKNASEKNFKKLDQEIAIVKQKITFIENSGKKVAEKITNMPELNQNLDTGRVLTLELDSLMAKRKNLENSLKLNSLLSSLLEKKVLYSGYLKISTSISGEKFPQRQYDAASRYNPVKQNLWDRRKNKEVPNSERLQWVVYNVPDGTKIKFTEESVAFTDTDLFTKLVGDEFAKIDFSTLSSDILGTVQDYFNSFLKIPVTKNKGGGSAADCVEAREIIKKIYEKLDEGSLDLKPRAKPYFQQQESAPVFRTEQTTSTIEQEEPHTVNTTITRAPAKDSTRTETVRKATLNVGNERFLILSSGIAFNRSPVTSTQLDASSTGFMVTTADSRARALFGFKFFPGKNYNRDHGIIPRYFLKRFSIFGGAEILKPLNNFYVGGAYDLVPGLAFSAGRNYTLQSRYSVENNVITKTSRSYVNSGVYYSVMVNPTLFVQFVKTFFK